jgi:hypothetical protein
VLILLLLKRQLLPKRVDYVHISISRALSSFHPVALTHSPKNGTMMVGRALTSPQAVVPAPPWCTTTDTLLNSHSGCTSVYALNCLGRVRLLTVWTITKIEDLASVWASPTKFAPSSGYDSTNSTSCSGFKDDVGQSLRVIDDYATKPYVNRRRSST